MAIPITLRFGTGDTAAHMAARLIQSRFRYCALLREKKRLNAKSKSSVSAGILTVHPASLGIGKMASRVPFCAMAAVGAHHI